MTRRPSLVPHTELCEAEDGTEHEYRRDTKKKNFQMMNPRSQRMCTPGIYSRQPHSNDYAATYMLHYLQSCRCSELHDDLMTDINDLVVWYMVPLYSLSLSAATFIYIFFRGVVPYLYLLL